MLYPGQKVVCIRADIRNVHAIDGLAKMPVKGQVYTIRDAFDYEGSPQVRLEEILNPLHPTAGIEFCYWAERFRPAADIGWAQKIVAVAMNRRRAKVNV